ncbi:ankyrin repeat domain-containing protein [Candidatus Sumerlaeota bacterium]|nr:ankyrin repeat domain-containing protein [Candidatus Sumerlaeota bacterium]
MAKYTKLMELCMSFDSTVEDVRRATTKYGGINDKDLYGRTALHYCFMSPMWKEDGAAIIKLLLEHSADPEAGTTIEIDDPEIFPIRAGIGWTPLLECAYSGYAAQMKALLEFGANVDKQTSRGITALMIAVNGTIEPIKKVALLKKYGASIHKKDSEGLTAYDHAMLHLFEMKDTLNNPEFLRTIQDTINESGKRKFDEQLKKYNIKNVICYDEFKINIIAEYEYLVLEWPKLLRMVEISPNPENGIRDHII